MARLGAEDEAPTIIRGRHLATAKFLPAFGAGSWSLVVDSDRGQVELKNADALRILGRALIQSNSEGAGSEDLKLAVRRIETYGSADAFLGSVVESVAARAKRPRLTLSTAKEEESVLSGTVSKLPELTRLALEIAAHEQIELLALEGELATLEQMWRDAEEIAAIADNLLVPTAVIEAWRRLRGA